MNTNNSHIHDRLMLNLNQYIYRIDDRWYTNDKNIHQYLEGNLFVSNHTDDNHKLIELQNERFTLRKNNLRVQPVLLCVNIRENPQYSFSQCEQLDPPTAGRQ
jgi:hypothetical protein